MKNLLPTYILAMVLTICACNSPEANTNQPRTRESFDSDWLFMLTDNQGVEKPEYDDSQWRKLNLPHDWAIEGDFSADNPSGYAGGALPGGMGWYRKHFIVDSADLAEGRQIYLDFDGVYMLSTVYINGVSTGTRPYGYISFRRNITPLLHPGENVVAVSVDNTLQPNSRWYSGCGIYRHVWMVKTQSIHIDNWGTYVTTPGVDDKSATINIATRVRNTTANNAKVTISQQLLDANGKIVAQGKVDVNIPCDTTAEKSIDLILKNPYRWSIEEPYLYTVRTILFNDSAIIDSYDTPMGVRTYRFDAKEGFFLNDKPVKIKGVCMHHDLGCLGAAVNTRAIERQLEILKEMGCNAYRCSHNPPAPEVLDLCDRMGFIVMDEALDMWSRPKTQYDYARFFKEWHERDITDLVLRDRNHPSIFMWSLGNEVREQWTHEASDILSLDDANMPLNLMKDASALAQEGTKLSTNSLITRRLCEIVKNLDSRPTTTGNDEPNPSNHLFRAGTLDIIGYNYHVEWFDSVPGWFPDKPFIATESASGLMTRGYYEQPSDSMMPRPIRWDIPYIDASYSCSSYDHVHAPWGSTHEKNWRMVKERDYVSGTFIWTGFDYIGEPTPYKFPARSSYFGIVDLAGFPKDIYYMYKSEWSNDTVLHLFPHWNHAPGETIDMCCYYNHADEVELWINDVSQGVRTKPEGKFHAMWRVVYEPGEVRVVSRKDGKEVLSQSIRTAGEPAHIRLTADRTSIQADGQDLSFVTVEILDKEGNLCPLADNLVTFDIIGNAFIAGVDNGSPYSMERFKANHRKAFYGKCLVILQNNGERGTATLTATANGLTEAQIAITAQ
ncbi:MAG: DUF4982 domain-containing protein [Bacteroidaceae bacterium]|nr:DUF4982 domain-containing protein [Bacteroidaceae bacterium]